ncbi:MULTISPECIES: hypothetical protein [Chryseobacterium]|uniref:hypothetical protein n=1 Tax=Chryseobacterium TaxID=59732 RepID=UPI001BE88CA0|nr:MULTISPECIES: hypothetical protein [Chryseobacterium]MBT2623333.1 hypothetical protein [Chryseobacterium sp. ISL-6]
MRKEELYDLKYTLSESIYPMLKAFKDKVDKKEMPTLPDFKNEIFFEDKKMTVDLMFRFWSDRLGEMIFPFEYYCYPKKFENISIDEREEKIQKGLDVFAKYFNDLWI